MTDASVTVSFAGPGVVSSAFASTMSQAQKQHQPIREMVLTVPGRTGTQRYTFTDCAVESFYVLNGESKLVVLPARVATEAGTTTSKSGSTFDARLRH